MLNESMIQKHMKSLRNKLQGRKLYKQILVRVFWYLILQVVSISQVPAHLARNLIWLHSVNLLYAKNHFGTFHVINPKSYLPSNSIFTNILSHRTSTKTFYSLLKLFFSFIDSRAIFIVFFSSEYLWCYNKIDCKYVVHLNAAPSW